MANPRISFTADNPGQWKFGRLLRYHKAEGHNCRVLLDSTQCMATEFVRSLPEADQELFRDTELIEWKDGEILRDIHLESGEQILYSHKWSMVPSPEIKPKMMRVIFIPYAIFLDKNYSVQFPPAHVNLVDKIIVPRGTADFSTSHLPSLQVRKFVELGYPSSDYIDARGESRDLSGVRKEPTVLWSPHWSLGGSKYSISTFRKTAEQVLSLATQAGSQWHWILRPHPVLALRLRESVGRKGSFLSRWSSLANTSFSQRHFALDFARSDLQILDSLSFLAEFSLTGLPSVFLERKGKHYGNFFNPMGQDFYEANYSLNENLALSVEDFPIKESTEKAQHRLDTARKYMLPPSGRFDAQVVSEVMG